MVGQYLGTPVIAVVFQHVGQLVVNHPHQAVGIVEDIQQIINAFDQLTVLINNLVLLQPGDLVQAQVENGLRLDFRQPVHLTVKTKPGFQPIRTRCGCTRALQQISHNTRRPLAAYQFSPRFGAAGRGFDQRDDFVDIGQRYRQAFQHMRPLARLAQQEHGAARYDITAMTDKGFEDLFKIQQAWLAIDQRDHIDTEHALHLGLLVQVVEHHLGHFVALEFDHHAHAVLVRLVAQVGDTFDLLVLDQLGNLFQQSRLVDLVG